MADQGGGVPAPNPNQQQQQPQQQQQQEQIQDEAGQQQQVVHLSWSNFKPEFLGKLDEDTEAHLLCSNDWRDAHYFGDGVRVQRFCLTLLAEARLWYHSLEPINVDWQGLQNLFRQQYSKVGNTWEQLFHAWRSFNFDENTETIDAYVTHIRQVAALLGNGNHKFWKYSRIHFPQNCTGYCFSQMTLGRQ